MTYACNHLLHCHALCTSYLLVSHAVPLHAPQHATPDCQADAVKGGHHLCCIECLEQRLHEP